MNPVVTSPSIVTSSTSASNPPVETRPQAVKAGPGCAPSPALERWKALRSSRSSAVIVCASGSSVLFRAHSGSPNGSSGAASGTVPGAPSSGIPATVRCDPVPPSSRAVSASTTWLPTVRPKRTIHAFGIGSVLLMVPVAVASSMMAPEAFDSVSVIVSLPSSWASSITGTDTVFVVLERGEGERARR